MFPFFKKKNDNEEKGRKDAEKKQKPPEKIVENDRENEAHLNLAEKELCENKEKKECREADLQEKNTEADKLTALERREINRTKWKNTQLDYEAKTTSKTKICAMKKIGIAHIRNEMPCQDYFKIEEEKDYRIVVIADGHGSKKHDLSEFGSRIACESLIETVNNFLRKKQNSKQAVEELCSIKFKSSLTNQWKINVKKHFLCTFNEDFDEENTYVRYGTTLLFAIDYEDDFIVGQLGDGGILLADGNGYYKKHRDDEKIGSGTASVCSENSYMLLSITAYSKKNISRIMLMTDGMYDIFGEDKPLYENFDYFIEHFNGEPEDAECFNEKYNSYVEYISDDTTVALMKSTPIKGEKTTKAKNMFTGEEYEILSKKIRGAISEYILKKNNGTPCMILGNFLPERKIRHFGVSKAKSHILFPEAFLKIQGRNEETGLLYNLDDGFITIDEYFEMIVKKKATKSDIELFFKVSINMIDLIDELEGEDEYFDEVMFRKMFRFNVETGECVLLWYKENNKKYWQNRYQKHIQQIVADYIFDLLFSASCGNLNILDGLEYNLVSDILKKNISDRVPEKLSGMLLAVKKGESVEFDEFRKEIILGLRRLVSCSGCGRKLVLDLNLGKCPYCGREFINIGEMIAEDERLSSYSIPMVIGAGYSSNNIGFGKFKSIITFVYSEKLGRYGIKNDSGISWTAYDEADIPYEVPTGNAKGLDNTKKIRIRDKTVFIKLKGE